MNTRIEFCQNSTGLNWFVDAIICGGWKNIGSFRTEEEAKEVISKINGERND